MENTDKFIKGKTSMKISVKNWERIKNVAAVPDRVTITLFNSSGKVVDSKVVSISNASGSASFSDLSASTKYYVEFAVGTTGNQYSFNGSIY